MQERTVIINQMRMLFEQLIALDSIQPQPEPPKEKPGVPVLLTVKECTELVEGLTMNTVRKLVMLLCSRKLSTTATRLLL